MNHAIRNRTLVAACLAALLAGGTATAAQPQHRDDAQHKARKEQQDARKARRDDHRKANAQHRDAPRKAAPQRRAIQQHQAVRRDARIERRDDHRDARIERRNDHRDTRQAQRVAYARYRQDYDRRARSVVVHVVPRHYVRPAQYRYAYGGRWYTTSHYGAEVLRMAVENGYAEGLRAGRADRFDGWPGGFRQSFAWLDAGFGYPGRYVSRADYAYYFRQGFERGYEDGYYGRMRHGRRHDDGAIILEAVLATILGLQLLR